MVRARAGLSAFERLQLARWLLKSPSHVTEYLRAGRLDASLRDFRGWSRLPRLEASSDRMRRADVVHLSDFRVPEVAIPKPKMRGPQRIALAAAASVAVAVIGWFGIFQGHGQRVRTESGEIREITLADGSALQLLPQSDVQIEYSRQARAIRLDHGKAFFRVEKDPARPFIVDAAGVRTRAVGTMFSVERNAGGVVVAVQEGVVDVHALPTSHSVLNDAAPPKAFALRAEESVAVDGYGIRGPVSRVEAAAAPWVPRSIEFEDSTVADVATWFNARNHIQVEIPDPGVARRRISGVFASNDPQSFVRFVESVGGATSEASDDRIVLHGPRSVGMGANRSNRSNR
jgi:transmembrane sensor